MTWLAGTAAALGIAAGALLWRIAGVDVWLAAGLPVCG